MARDPYIDATMVDVEVITARTDAAAYFRERYGLQSYNGAQTLDSARADHVIELSRPLGDRKVIDATTGKPIRPRGDHP